MIDIRQDVGRKKTSIYRTLYYMPYKEKHSLKWSKKNKFSKKKYAPRGAGRIMLGDQLFIDFSCIEKSL